MEIFLIAFTTGFLGIAVGIFFILYWLENPIYPFIFGNNNSVDNHSKTMNPVRYFLLVTLMIDLRDVSANQSLNRTRLRRAWPRHCRKR
jgi:O-antigen/teichoic acid export membrane protein